MTAEITLVLSILAVVILLFVSEKVRPDIVAMLALVSLAISGLLTPQEAFSGFSSPAVITVWAVFIISGGLTRSGVADRLASLMLRLCGKNEAIIIIVIMLIVGGMSAFMNNIGAVAILLPAVISVARQTNIPTSKLLIPLAWASLMGGNMTLIGTPPNILASGMMEAYGVTPFRFFDFAPMGILVLITGILYMTLVGRRLLPSRTTGGEITQSYPIQDYLTEVQVQENSPLIDKTLESADLSNRHDINVLRIYRADGQRQPVSRMHRFLPGDELLIEADANAILSASETLKLIAAPVQKAAETSDTSRNDKASFVMAEIVLSPNSSLKGQTLRQINLRALYGLNVLAIRSHGRLQISRMANTAIAFGSSILVEGPPEKIALIRHNPDFLVLDTPQPEIRNARKAPIAIAILAAVLVLTTLGWLSVPVAMLIGALLMVISRILNMEEAYKSISWQSVFLIAGMLPMGLAMEKTGTATFLADQIIAVVGAWGPMVVLMGLYLLTSLLTEVMSNAAATVLVVPIAVDAAFKLGADPHSFIMGIVIAASTSFLMPVGHQANVIVFGPGGYRFFDYTKVGVGLNLALFFLVFFTLPLIWPLFP